MSEDWRVDSHDRQIEKITDDLREANDKIRALEQRPLDWLAKVMPVIAALLLGACLALVIAGVIHKH